MEIDERTEGDVTVLKLTQIAMQTGEMSLAISDPDAAILVFGRCLTHEETGTP